MRDSLGCTEGGSEPDMNVSVGLMGLFEKRRFRKFLIWAQNLDEEKQESWEGLDINRDKMDKVYAKFGLDKGTIDFIGHAIALYHNDEYTPPT